MRGSSWIEPEAHRESWLILIIGTEKSPPSYLEPGDKITYWEIGVGNPGNLVDVTANHIDNPQCTSEAKLLQDLMNTLAPKRYQNSTILTPDDATIRTLRSRLANYFPKEASLHGFNHISINPTLRQEFAQDQDEFCISRQNWEKPQRSERKTGQVEPSDTPRQLWESWTNHFRLLPPTSVQGDPL